MPTELQNPFERGPYVQIAAFCERVLREADGVVSLIRIVDVVTHTERGTSPPEDMPEVHYPLFLVVNMKSGTARGRHQVAITPEQPSGETLPPIEMSVNMEGEGKGVNIISRIDPPYKMEGLYWFAVRFDNQIITRLPLEVRYSRMVTGSPNPG
ncbi:MAG: hypothetical protein A2147_02595 [Chloroflexi bacterium RBG_16_57_8]|nr:MAG: hypothetical protein A2147_02595 [Chloroflexi bacterium RBG_16_57_8]